MLRGVKGLDDKYYVDPDTDEFNFDPNKDDWYHEIKEQARIEKTTEADKVAG